MASRFLVVGLLNTALGYAVILLALRLGAGDYVANAAGYAAGLILAYVLHRRWTFAVTSLATFNEMGRFAVAAMIAYAANLSVIYLARSMGHVDNPLTQAAAMAAYSVSFFLLTRYMVFADAGSGAARGRRLRLESFLPECSLIGVALLIGLFMQNHMRLAHDILWQFWIARQLLGGAHLYTDIWEVNPPLWFWSAMPVEWLAEQTGIAWSSLLITLVVGLGVMSAWLVAELVDLPRQRDRLGVLLPVLVMTTVLPLPYLGQREQLALVTSLPYAALIARRYSGQSVPLALAVGVAALAAYGFALKHYFTLVPLLLELWLGLRLQRRWRPWRPELIVLAGLAVAYAATVIAFAPEFLSIMVPMVRTAYYAFDPSLLFVLVKPYVLFWAVAGLFLILTRDGPLLDTTPAAAALLPAMLLTSAGFALGYVLQGKGWDYHSIPATGAMAIATGLRLLRLRRVLPAAAGAALLVGLVLCMYPARRHVASYDPYLDRVPVGDAVFVATIDGSAVWSPDRHKLTWVSRAYSLWMMPAIAQGELVGPNPPQLRRLATHVLSATSQDIRCNPPYLILLENMPAINGKAGTFTYQDFLFRDGELRRFVADHYSVQPISPRGTAYLRRGPVSRVAGQDCRNIR